MAVKTYKLGEFIVPYDCRNKDLSVSLFQGITTNKVFSSPKQVADDISSTKIVRNGQFAYNRATTRNGEKISIAYREGADCAVSAAYQVFYLKSNAPLLPKYLYMFFNRKEFDRYVRCNSWGSAHEFFTFEDMCNIEIKLPDLPTQQKYVQIYESLVANQKSYEKGLEDLKLVCDGYIEDLRRKMPCEPIGKYIKPVDVRNKDLKVSLAQGITNDKEFATPKQVADEERNAKIVRTGQFAYNRATTRNGEKISIAYRTGPDCVVSSAYQIFEIKEKEKLFAEYLMMWFKRSEFDRYARYMSKGSAHEFFEYNDMEEVQIPIPDINVQKSIANIYKVYNERKRINEQLKQQIKDICPILIKGSLEE